MHALLFAVLIVASIVALFSMAYGLSSTLELLDDEWYSLETRRQFWVLMAQATYNFVGLLLFGWYFAARYCVRWYRKLGK